MPSLALGGNNVANRGALREGFPFAYEVAVEVLGTFWSFGYGWLAGGFPLSLAT